MRPPVSDPPRTRNIQLRYLCGWIADATIAYGGIARKDESPRGPTRLCRFTRRTFGDRLLNRGSRGKAKGQAEQ